MTTQDHTSVCELWKPSQNRAELFLLQPPYNLNRAVRLPLKNTIHRGKFRNDDVIAEVKMWPQEPTELLLTWKIGDIK
jgi:hypothetical protein